MPCHMAGRSPASTSSPAATMRSKVDRSRLRRWHARDTTSVSTIHMAQDRTWDISVAASAGTRTA